MAPYSTGEMILTGVLVLLVILWFRPSIRAALARSRQAEAHWGELVLPLGLVALFVIFLIMAS